MLWYIASKRRLPKETTEQCFERLKMDSKRFVKIYTERAVLGMSSSNKEGKKKKFFDKI